MSEPGGALRESRRGARAREGAIAIALALAAWLLGARASSLTGPSVDLGAGAPSRPSVETLASLRSARVRATLFATPSDASCAALVRYLSRAADEGALALEVLDVARSPVRARELGVRADGVIVLATDDGRRAMVEIGTDPEGSRFRLRELDARMREALARLLAPPATLAVARGHGEMSERDAGARGLGVALRLARGAGLRTLDVADLRELADLSRAEPTVIAIVASPSVARAPEELEALARFVESGGRALVAIDPDREHGLGALLERLGAPLREGTLASADEPMRGASGALEPTLLRGQPLGIHPAIASLTEGAGLPVIVARAGAFAIRDAATPLVWGPERAFLDLDGDLAPGPGEAPGRAPLAVAVEPARGRAVLLADGDVLSDALIAQGGDALLFADALRWLAEEEDASLPRAAVDPPVALTGPEERAVLAVSAIALPLSCVGIAAWLSWRARRP